MPWPLFTVPSLVRNTSRREIGGWLGGNGPPPERNGEGLGPPRWLPVASGTEEKKKKAGTPFTAAAPSLHSRFEDVRAHVSPLFLFQGVTGSRSCFSTKEFLKKPKQLV